LDKIGLVNNISAATIAIDYGRKGFATRGKEQEGRISYETGIAKALSAFQEAQSSADPQTIILAEYTFISQELEFCEEADKDSFGSLTQAIQSFDDAFLALQVVDESCYKITEKAFPHSGKYRISDFPKDSFHIACIAHRTRLQNILRSPGIDPIEKSLLKQRLANLSAARRGDKFFARPLPCPDGHGTEIVVGQV
jgi:hypothetical protein